MILSRYRNCLLEEASCSQLVYGASGRDGQSIFIKDRHVCCPKVIRGGPNVVVGGVSMGAVWKNPLPDVINEGRINQMICTLKEEYHDETDKIMFCNKYATKVSMSPGM